jgi:hypothetical protein
MQFFSYMFLGTTTRVFRTGWMFLLVLGTLSVAHGQGSGSTTQAMTAAINPIAALIVGASAALIPGAARFWPFQVTLPISYWARTTPTGTGATITAQVTSNFAPAGGPSAASGALQYTCTAATYGTACSATQTASTASQTPVLNLPTSACTGGGGACSAAALNTVDLNFTLTDDPTYQTGSYSAVVTFTISAT